MTSLLHFQWGENLELMYDRILRYPDRVRNLYFTFLFVLRAVTKVGNTASYCYFRTPYIHIFLLKVSQNIYFFPLNLVGIRLLGPGGV